MTRDSAVPPFGNMTPANVPLRMRAPLEESERNFIRKSWSASYAPHRPARIWRSEGHVTKTLQMPLGLYYQTHSRYVDTKLPFCILAIARASSPNMPGQDVIAGYICVEGDRLHYLYVASPFRRFGVARQLAAPYASTNMVICNWTPVLEQIQLPKTWTYNEIGKWL